MKKFFTGRGGAIIVAVVVVLLSTYFGAYRSLSIDARAVADGFSDGVEYKDGAGDTYVHKSIRSQLVNRSEACLNLASVARNFAEVKAQEDALRAAANTMRDLIYTESGPRALYDANVKLESAFQALSSRLDDIEMDDRDRENVAAARLVMKESTEIINESGYNESVRRFDRDTLSIFPTSLFKTICFIKEPELFDVSSAAADEA